MDKTNSHEQNRNPGGQWAKGESGNPAGRPAGSRNKATLMLQEMLDVEGAGILRKAVLLALEGEPHAMRLCVERLMPAVKERKVALSLPDVQTAQDARAALSTILTAVGDGEITPGEGEKLAAIVEIQSGAVMIADLERRVEELEKTANETRGGQR